MKKEICKVEIQDKVVGFERAVLYVGRKNSLTYILLLIGPKNLPDPLQNEQINIITNDGDRRTITGTLDYVSSHEAKFYISGEPYPITEQDYLTNFHMPNFDIPKINIPKVPIQVHKFAELYKPFAEISNAIKRITSSLNRIDWSSLSKAAAERIKEIDGLLIEHEEYNWCLDIDIFDAIGEQETTFDKLSVSEYVDENLEQYVAELTEDPMFELHISLIEETYEAYKAGYYKLCTFPLFSTFEHIIASWYEGNINNDEISVRVRPKGRQLYNKIKKLNNEEKGQSEYIKVFAQSVLRMYEKTFVTFPDEPNKELNRHSIAHGFHDYDSITKTEVLTLFQLLKASLILKYISLEEFQNEDQT